MSEYTDRITAEHADKPKFVALVDAITGDASVIRDFDLSLISAFDLDLAVGAQLDAVGEWVGISRNVAVPIAGVYFSFDVAGLGFDQGVWKGPFDPDTGLTILPDDTYRILIRAKIGANRWDGSMTGWKAIIDQVFGPSGQIPVTANNEVFGTTDGTRTQFQLTYAGFPIYTVSGVTVYRNDWQGSQLLYAMPRTNLIVGSTLIGGSGWTLIGGTTVTPNNPSPDGTNSANLLTSTNGVTCYAQSAAAFAVSPNTTYTSSIFVKQGTSISTAVVIFNAAVTTTVGSVIIGWSGGVPVITSTSGSVSNAVLVPCSALGYYRLSYAINTGVNSSIRELVYVDRNNTGGSTYAWGSSFGDPGAYIATTTSPRTITDYTLTNTGLVTIADPTSGALLSWSGAGTQSTPGSANVFVQDNGDMTMTVVVAGIPPSALFLALLTGGYLPLKPEAIGVAFYLVNTVPGSPAFGFDAENDFVSGFDIGSWTVPA